MEFHAGIEAEINGAGRTAIAIIELRTLKRRMNLVSGRFALIERSHEFTLVPWRDELERHVGKQLSGLMREDRPISWTIGRGRGDPSIGGM